MSEHPRIHIKEGEKNTKRIAEKKKKTHIHIITLNHVGTLKFTPPTPRHFPNK